MRRSLLVVFAACVAVPLASQAPMPIGVGISASTMGIGVDGAVQVMPRIGLRGRLAFMPYKPKFTVSGIEYEMELPSPQAGLFADVFLVGGLRVTGGLRYSSKGLSASGVIPGTVTIGDSTYSGSEIGTWSGAITTKKLAPYLGLGFGRVAGHGLGIFFDAGVAFHGTPTVTFSADGPIASQAQFQTELAKEQADANDSISSVTIYPVIALGLRYGF